MPARLKKKAYRKKAGMFQFMKETPRPKNNKELYNHVVQFLMYGNGTPKDAVEMLEDYGVDRKKAVGIVNSIVKGRTSSAMTRESSRRLAVWEEEEEAEGPEDPVEDLFDEFPWVDRDKIVKLMGRYKDVDRVRRILKGYQKPAGIGLRKWRQPNLPNQEAGGPEDPVEGLYKEFPWVARDRIVKLVEKIGVDDPGRPRIKDVDHIRRILKGYQKPADLGLTEWPPDVPEPGARAQRNLLKDKRMSAKQRRTAKMDIMTGFTGSKPPDLDLGLDGNGYFEKWTTLSLPDTGKNSALDDEQQPSGGGAPATVIPGSPLKTPMEADDVTRPKLREGREARRQKADVLRKVASEIRRLDPITARRLMAAADEISYDALSTATLPEAGDESNEVDDYQDNLGHGTLQFFGTDPAKSTSLTRESSRRRRTATEDFTRCEISFKYPGDNWEKFVCTSKEEYDKKMKELKEGGAEVKVRHFDNGEVDTNLQYASRGASRRRSAGEGKGVKNIDWTNTLKLVDSALEGKYDRGAVAHILKSDFDRTMGMLKNGQGGQNGEMVPGQQGQHATASRKNRRARTEGDPSLKPEPTVGDQDGPGADGAGGFVDRSKAPLQETMTAQDVDRPKIRENPEAARLASLWNAFRSELLRQASGTGKWNSGRYNLEARDYGDSVEVQASVVDRENLPMPVGSILFSKISDSPRGRYATVEVNDGILENRTTEFTLQRPRQAGIIVRRLVAGVVQSSKDLIDGITV